MCKLVRESGDNLKKDMNPTERRMNTETGQTQNVHKSVEKC